MKRVIILSLLVNILLSACSCSYQYDVRVQNGSSDELQITYFSNNDRLSNSPQSILLKQGESRLIISSIDIEVSEGCTGIQPDHAQYVAEYISAVNQDGIESKLKWGDPAIKFIREDFQQGSFLMEFKDEHFR